MARHPYIPRQNVQGWQDNFDTYNDVPDGGLAQTEAFEDATSVQMDIDPQRRGLRVQYSDNDNKRQGYVVTWAELVALAAGQNPADPRINAGANWIMVPDPQTGAMFPAKHIRDNQHKYANVCITPDEANSILSSYAAAWQRDPVAMRVFQVCRQLRGGR